LDIRSGNKICFAASSVRLAIRQRLDGVEANKWKIATFTDGAAVSYWPKLCAGDEEIALHLRTYEEGVLQVTVNACKSSVRSMDTN
jgi:hypothetical protein